MCGDWLRLDDEIARIMKGLALASGEETETSAAAAAATRKGHARAHHDGPDVTAVVVKFVPRKGPATEAAGQVKGGGVQTVTEDGSHPKRYLAGVPSTDVTRRSASLAIRR